MSSAESSALSLTLPVTVVVTRPQPQADAWVKRLQAEGQAAVALPLLRIEADDTFAPQVAVAWQGLAALALVMFVSPNAALAFFARQPTGAAWPSGLLAAATGPGTESALREAGVPAANILAPAADSPRFDAETLWAQALRERDWAGRAVLIVRGEAGRDWLADTLRAAGAQVQCLAAYRQQGPLWCDADEAVLAHVLARPGAHAWLFSSSSAIQHLVGHLRASHRLGDGLAVPVLATHPRIGETARALGFAQVRQVTPDPVAVAALFGGQHAQTGARPGVEGAPIESTRPHE